MRLSSLADYAISLMTEAAGKCGAVRLNATMLANGTGIPLPTAQKLVGLLVKAELLRSGRGSGGGIRLARPAAAISLADIIEAIEGPIALVQCVEHDRPDCAVGPLCRVSPHLTRVNGLVRGALNEVKLAELVDASAEREMA